eukprot:1973345-Rhodomonas_salina.1
MYRIWFRISTREGIVFGTRGHRIGQQRGHRDDMDAFLLGGGEQERRVLCLVSAGMVLLKPRFVLDARGYPELLGHRTRDGTLLLGSDLDALLTPVEKTGRCAWNERASHGAKLGEGPERQL